MVYFYDIYMVIFKIYINIEIKELFIKNYYEIIYKVISQYALHHK